MKRVRNEIVKYMKGLFESEEDRYNEKWLEHLKLLEKRCIYYPEYFEKKEDRTIFESLRRELEEKEQCELKSWSKHFKFENPLVLPTFQKIIERLGQLFNVEIIETRLNFYPDENSWKPYHHDRHYSGQCREDFTMGASFGSTRFLAFRPVEDEERFFQIPQTNGDIFAFDATINKLFQHGIPKSSYLTGPRFSLIAWGRLNIPLNSLSYQVPSQDYSQPENQSITNKLSSCRKSRKRNQRINKTSEN